MQTNALYTAVIMLAWLNKRKNREKSEDRGRAGISLQINTNLAEEASCEALLRHKNLQLYSSSR